MVTIIMAIIKLKINKIIITIIIIIIIIIMKNRFQNNDNKK